MVFARMTIDGVETWARNNAPLETYSTQELRSRADPAAGMIVGKIVQRYPPTASSLSLEVRPYAKTHANALDESLQTLIEHGQLAQKAFCLNLTGNGFANTLSTVSAGQNIAISGYSLPPPTADDSENEEPSPRKSNRSKRRKRDPDTLPLPELEIDITSPSQTFFVISKVKQFHPGEKYIYMCLTEIRERLEKGLEIKKILTLVYIEDMEHVGNTGRRVYNVFECCGENNLIVRAKLTLHPGHVQMIEFKKKYDILRLHRVFAKLEDGKVHLYGALGGGTGFHATIFDSTPGATLEPYASSSKYYSMNAKQQESIIFLRAQLQRILNGRLALNAEQAGPSFPHVHNKKLLSELKTRAPGAYFDIVGQVVAKTEINLQSGAMSCVLRLWDGTKPPFELYRLDCLGNGNGVAIDPGEDSESLITRQRDLSSLTANQGYAVDVAVYDEHTPAASAVAVGSFILLVNIHLYKPPNAGIGQLEQITMHGGGRSWGRKVMPIPVSHRMVVSAQTRMKPLLQQWEYDARADLPEQFRVLSQSQNPIQADTSGQIEESQASNATQRMNDVIDGLDSPPRRHDQVNNPLYGMDPEDDDHEGSSVPLSPIPHTPGLPGPRVLNSTGSEDIEPSSFGSLDLMGPGPVQIIHGRILPETVSSELDGGSQSEGQSHQQSSETAQDTSGSQENSRQGSTLNGSIPISPIRPTSNREMTHDDSQPASPERSQLPAAESSDQSSGIRPLCPSPGRLSDDSFASASPRVSRPRPVSAQETVTSSLTSYKDARSTTSPEFYDALETLFAENDQAQDQVEPVVPNVASADKETATKLGKVFPDSPEAQANEASDTSDVDTDTKVIKVKIQDVVAPDLDRPDENVLMDILKWHCVECDKQLSLDEAVKLDDDPDSSFCTCGTLLSNCLLYFEASATVLAVSESTSPDVASGSSLVKKPAQTSLPTSAERSMAASAKSSAVLSPTAKSSLAIPDTVTIGFGHGVADSILGISCASYVKKVTSYRKPVLERLLSHFDKLDDLRGREMWLTVQAEKEGWSVVEIHDE